MMKISELLRHYRLQQAKTQKEWAGNVVSPSYYSKVEKNIHRITAEDLVELLYQNYISPIDFFSRLDSKDQAQRDNQKEFERLIYSAYYRGSVDEVVQIKRVIAETDLPDKADLNMLVEVCIALLNDNIEGLDDKLKAEIKEKIFNTTEFDKNQLSMYCNCMPLYDIDSNILIVRRVVRQFANNTDIEIQAMVLAIISNMLELCITNNKYEETQPFIVAADQIRTKPELFFYKNAIMLLTNFIEYHFDQDRNHLVKVKAGVQNFFLLGMPEYGKEVEKELENYQWQTVDICWV